MSAGVRGLLVGLSFGLTFMLWTAIVAGRSLYALRFGAELGLVLGVAFGLIAGASGRQHLVFVLCSRGKLPWRLGIFLDWACTAGLLRFAGAAYQFRHRELQEWLARHPAPPAV